MERLRACSTAEEREKLIASGLPKANSMLNMETLEDFYRPQIGSYLLMESEDDPGYNTATEAMAKAREIKEKWS